MSKPAVKPKGISKPSLLYLRRKFWMLYLYSPHVRHDFWRLALLSSGQKKPRPKKLIRLFIKSIEEFDQEETAKLKKFYSRSQMAHLALGFAAICCLSVALQLLYPSDRALPFARLQASGHMGFAHKDKILGSLEDFDRRLVKVHTHNKEITTSYTDLGVRINTENTFKDLSDYTLKERLIPFSALFIGNKTFQIERRLDHNQLELFVNDVVAERDKQPADAAIVQRDSEVTLVPAQEGFKYEKAELESQILRSDLSDQSKIVFAPTVLYPSITTYVANDRAANLKTRLSTPLTISAEDKSLIIAPEIMATWLVITPQPEKGDIDIGLDETKLKDYLRRFVAEFDYPPSPSETTLLNGFSAGRVPGKNGRALQINQLVEQIKSVRLSATSVVQASVNHIPPKEIISRRYSRDSLGLQALLRHWTDNNPGNYGIAVKDLNGRISAGINQNQHYSAVGVYRLFLATMVYSKISAGSISGSSRTSAGQTVNQCLDKMIYDSHSACTDALGAIVGWGASDSFLRAQGFNITTLVKGASITTANDAASWLEKLYSRSITSDTQAGTLLSVMSRQVNRAGIPAGTPGIRVDNKAGYYGRFHHDVGLVYHPKGKYIVAVLSQDSSFGRIADLSREIEKVFDQ